MSFPPPPPPPSGGNQPGEVPGYPGPGHSPLPYDGTNPYSSPSPAGPTPGSDGPPPPPPFPQGSPQYPAPAYNPAGQYGDLYPRNHASGTTVLVLGILGIVTSCFPLGIIAWVMGKKALNEIDASGVTYSNRGTVQAGYILGIIGTVLFGLVLLYLIFMFMAVLVSL